MKNTNIYAGYRYLLFMSVYKRDLHRLITQQPSLFPKMWGYNMTNTAMSIEKGAFLQPIFLKAQVHRNHHCSSFKNNQRSLHENK
jgi:hypothetical protein